MRLGSLTIASGDPSATYRLRSLQLNADAAKNWTDVQALDGDFTGQSNVRFDGAMSASLLIGVQAATKDLLLTALAALRAELGQPNNTLIHDEPDSSHATVFRLLECARYSESQDVLFVNGLMCDVAVTIVLKPWAEGGRQSIMPSPFYAPASASLESLLGELPSPDKLVIDDGDGAQNIHTIIAALAPLSMRSKWIVEAEALTWTTMADDADAKWHGGHARKTTSASWQTATLDTSEMNYPSGRYRIWARVSQSAGTGYVKTDFTDQVAVTRTTPHLVCVGDVTFPLVDTVLGFESLLTLSVCSDGTHTFSIDYYLLFPLWLGYVSYHPSVVGTQCTEFEAGPEGVFVDHNNGAASVQGGVLRPRILAAHVPNLVSPSSPVGSVWPAAWYRSDAAKITAESDKFKIAITTGTQSFYYAYPSGDGPVAIPHERYELTFTRQMTAYTSGNGLLATVYYLNPNGNDLAVSGGPALPGFTWAAVDGSPVACTLESVAQPGAAWAVITFAAYGSCTVYISNVVFRRSPLQLLVAGEQTTETTASKTLAVLFAHTPRYGGIR